LPDEAESAHPASIKLGVFVATVITAAATAAAVSGVIFGPRPDPIALGLLTVLAIAAEVLQMDLYGDGSISVSAAINFAAGVIAGMPGVVCASAAVALVHYIRRRPRLYKMAFNWATHTLAGTAPVMTINALTIPLHAANLLLLAFPATVAALAYYAIDTGLIAGAIAMSAGLGIMSTWRRQYRWLATHYLVLCILGLFLAAAYTALGAPGVIVFVLPIFMMRYAQKQYVDRTTESVRELKRMNDELVQANSEIVAGSEAIQQLNNELHAMNSELFLTLAKIIDARDPYVHGHAIHVADYAAAIAMELGLPAERIERIRQAALLHDIGKIGISENVLHKPSKLTAEEYEYVKTHVTIGADFLRTCRGLRHLAPFVRHHHEWWNGRGYPDGLKGEEIPIEARILAVCDAVEAMASDRPYHRAMALDEILAELQRCSGTQFDPVIVEAFIKVVEQKGEDLVVNSACEVDLRQADAWPVSFSRNGGLHPPTEWSARKKKAELAS
ncbi:MAG: HD-GYP domain-containing protein, partial [Chloroflexi bacterium]